jgi:hypothetical protein
MIIPIVYEQRLSSRKTEALFILLTALFLSEALRRFVRFAWDFWTILFLALGVIFLFYVFNYRNLRIALNGKALILRFGIFRMVVPLTNIQDYSVDDTSLWRIGGSGIHFTFMDGRYRAMFNFLEYPRLVIRLREKQGWVRDVAFSTQRPGELIKLLDHLLGK